MRITYEVDKEFESKMARMSGELANAVVSIVEKEFVELLMDAPQKSGNYVANFALAAGSALGRKSAGEYFPPSPTNAQIVNRGSHPAILVAMSNNSHFRKSMTGHIVAGRGGFTPNLTIYNRIGYAGEVEAYGVSSLRDPNKPGVHAFQKFSAKLQAAMNVTVVYGSTHFNHLANMRYL